MEIFTALEERIDRVIKEHAGLKARLAEVEQENATLKAGAGELTRATARIAELERERAEARRRLEAIAEKLQALDSRIGSSTVVELIPRDVRRKLGWSGLGLLGVLTIGTIGYSSSAVRPPPSSTAST